MGHSPRCTLLIVQSREWKHDKQTLGASSAIRGCAWAHLVVQQSLLADIRIIICDSSSECSCSLGASYQNTFFCQCISWEQSCLKLCLNLLVIIETGSVV